MEVGKIDFRILDKEYFTAGNRPKILELSGKEYITLDGKGRPDQENYQESIAAIYTTAYQLKYNLKKVGRDFVVPKLECLWWAEGSEDFAHTPPEKWHWKLLLRIPEYVDESDIMEAKDFVLAEKGLSLAARIGKEKLKEGKSVQVMHKGPYDMVGETYEKLSEFMESQGLKSRGTYHEIYISDPGKTPPENLKTIVRQPVK